jgi:hypothetical protein
MDTLTGGNGIDRVIFEETGSANVDTINTYNGSVTDRDIIDVSALVDAAFAPGNNSPANFVRIIQGGTSGDDIGNNDPNDFLVQVDVNGATGGASFQTVAVLNDYNNGAAGTQPVAVYLEGQEYQFQTPV